MVHKNRKTSEDFALEILTKFNLKLISQYTGAKIKCEVEGICGHTWEVIPSNLLCKGNKKDCRECAGLVKEYTRWDKNKLQELEEGINANLNIEELAFKLNSSIHAVNKTIEIYGLSRKTYKLKSSTIPRIQELIKTYNYTLLTNIEDIPNSYGRINYICENKHNYSQLITSFIGGHKCGICSENTRTSKGEKEVLEYIKSILPEDTWVLANDKSITDPKELDIILPDLGIAIEYNGNYRHSDLGGKDNNYHLNKFNQVEEFGYRLISITDEEWLTKQDIVKSRLNNIFGLNTNIYARKCILKEISYSELSIFCKLNHIQGSAVSSINLGLFFESTLVAIMSFSKARYTKDYEYELIRYCSSINTSVVGGASKLLKYFERTYNPKSLISYSDRRWNTGNLYTKLGFIIKNITVPNYRYIKGKVSYSRQSFMKHKLKELFPDIYSEDKTEKEIMVEAGYYRVYDCGNMVFVKEYT